MARDVPKNGGGVGNVHRTQTQDEGSDPILLFFLVLVGALIAALGMAAYLLLTS